MPKKVGYILEKVADRDNLRLAIKRSQRGGKAKRRRQIQRVNADVEGTVEQLRTMILTLNFPPHESRRSDRETEHGKVRRIEDEAYMPWKILSHAIMQVIEPILIPKLIANTSCCIRKRGLQYGADRFKRQIRRNPDMGWCVWADCRKFYPSLSHDWLRKVFAHYFKDKRFLKLLDICVLDYDCGDDIRKEIDDEKARHKDWLIHQQLGWESRL